MSYNKCSIITESKEFIENKDRIIAIDFIKGILVLFMVIYHSLNFLHIQSLPRIFMAFLTHSFVMITGFIVTHTYYNKYGLNRNKIRTRLLIRGLKLLFIFILLNAVSLYFWPRYSNGLLVTVKNLFTDLVSIYILGNPKTTAFDVLLPISYTLLLSALFPHNKSMTPYLFIILALMLFIACILMENANASIFTLNLISSGAIGMAIGVIPITEILSLFKSMYFLLLSLIIYLLCALYYGTLSYWMQIYSTVYSLYFMYSLVGDTTFNSLIARNIVIIGKYSLLGYISQIAYLKLYQLVIITFDEDIFNILTTIIVIGCATWLSIRIIDRCRKNNDFIDSIYKMFFA